MIRVLSRAGQSRLFEQEFRSRQGLHYKLSQSGSVQVFLHDEAHHFFKSMRNQTDHHLASIKPFLLQLFSSWGNPALGAGTVLSSQNRLDPLVYPSFSYCGVGVPEGAVDTFSSDDFSAGFLSRFIVFIDKKEVLPLSPDRAARQAVTAYDFEKDPEWLELIDKLTWIENERRTLAARPEEIHFEKIPHTDAARELYQGYSIRIAEKRNNLGDSEADIYSRAVELAGRLSLCLSPLTGPIGVTEVQFAIDLMDNYLRQVSWHVEDQTGSEQYQLSQKVLEILTEQGRPLSPREIMRCSRSLRSARETKEILSMLLDDGLIRECVTATVKNPRRIKKYEKA